MKKFSPLAVLAIAGLALTACGATDAQTEPMPVEASTSATPSLTATPEPVDPSKDSPSPDEYAFATGMTFGKVTTSGKPSKELDTYLEAVSKSVGESMEDEMTFWTVKIDNREGLEAAFPNELRAYDSKGEEYLFARTLDIVEAVNESLPELSDKATLESEEWKDHKKLHDMYITASESETSSANPGAVKEFTVVSGDELPDEFSKMTIDLGGLVGEADVITMDDAESQGYPMDF